MEIGIGFTPFETRADTIVRLAVRADRGGLAGVGVAEGWTHDAMILSAELAACTSRIGVGTGIVSVWGRTPATLALGAAGLQARSNGRFRLGLGAGSPPLAEGFHGLQWTRPLARMRATLTALRALLAGERLPDPVPGARALRVGVVPEVPVPLGLAALAPASIRLAGELADSWLPFLWARSRLQEGRDLLTEGEALAESPTPTRVAVGVPVALARDRAGADQLAMWWLTTYATRMGPIYPRLLGERFGMAHALDAVIDAADAARLPAAAERLAREVTLHGTYDDAPSLIDEWFDAGADELQLVLPPGRPEEELAELIDVACAYAGMASRRSTGVALANRSSTGQCASTAAASSW